MAVVNAAATVMAGLNFLAVGDWGGQTNAPYTEAGQVATAKGMGEVGDAIGSKFVLALGDNFYSSGIGSDSHDARFQQTFEDVYTADSLEATPWYVLSGNHDWNGNVSAQIEYSALSTRWNYPNYWHDFEETFTGSDGEEYTFQLVMIDTVIGVGQVDDHDDPNSGISGKNQVVPQSVKDEQTAWISETLANSTADFLWVAGHYPVWSACSHGPTPQLVMDLLPLLQQFGAHYMSGHDHCEEWISDSGVEYILTGNGDNCCYQASKVASIPANSLKYVADSLINATEGMTGGFTSFNVDNVGTTVTFRNQDGAALFTTPPFPARSVAIKDAARQRQEVGGAAAAASAE